jgi:hypothetical protein
MGKAAATKRSAKPARPAYVLDEQVGFILRQVSQRHAVIFARDIGIDLTPTRRHWQSCRRPDRARRTSSAGSPQWTSRPSRVSSIG